MSMARETSPPIPAKNQPILLLLPLDDGVTPSIGPTAPLSPPLVDVGRGLEVEDEDDALVAGTDVNVVGFGGGVVVVKTGRTVVEPVDG